MSTVEHRVPTAGLRSFVVHLDQGAVRFVRIDGNDVVVEGSEGISVERSGDQLRIGGGRRAARSTATDAGASTPRPDETSSLR